MKKLKRPSFKRKEHHKEESPREKHGIRHYVRKYWFVFFLILIFSVSLWFRLFPARWNELIGLDEFHIYRMAEYALNHNLMMYNQSNPDMMRYFPLGVSSWDADHQLPIYLPVFAYLLASAIGISMPFFEFAIIFPALLGAIGAILAFFIAKDLFKSNVSALFAAFFVSMTPALFTRTSAASFEKEATAVIFMMAAVWLFVRALDRKSWIYGSLGGVSLGLIGMAWGGVQYIYLLFATFFGVLFIANVALVILDYLFSGFGKKVEGIEKFMGPDALKAYAPFVLLGTLLPQLLPIHLEFTNISIISLYGTLSIMLIRYGLIRLRLVKKEKAHYIIPALMLAAVLGFFAVSMATDFFDGIIGGFMSMLTLSKSVVGSTVAENAPGDWATITSTLGTSFSSGVLPQLNFISPYMALWVFMLLGAFLVAYEFYRTQDWLLLLPLVWLGSTIFSIFWMVRLLFILGPAAGIVAGFFFGWSAHRIRKVKFLQAKGLKPAKLGAYLAIGALVALVVTVNLASTYVYALSINTAICFPKYKDQQNPNPFEVVPCVTIDKDGKQVLQEGQPWYEAMNFLSQKTPEGSVILSWWDFGYWFQVRGNRPSVADGGNLGGKYFRNYELADWYTDKPENWSGWVPWMKGYNVSYIFMDYSLPGKYGAISKIASRGENVLGFLEFQRTGMYPKDNKTTVEYTSGPYAIWLTFDNNGGLAGTPTFLVTQNGKYYSKAYINDMCTTNGIIRVANETQAMEGCVSISNLGVFYIPPEAEHTIFTNLMFMQGYGLPVEKVFDNVYVQIYKVNYDVSIG